MLKHKLIAGTIFGIAAGLFWFACDLFYGKAETLEAGVCCVIASIVAVSIFIPRIDKNIHRFYLFIGDRLGLQVTAISMFLTVLFLAVWKVYLDLEGASLNPLGGYYGHAIKTFFIFIGLGLVASPFLFIAATPFGALAGWIYIRLTKIADNEYT